MRFERHDRNVKLTMFRYFALCLLLMFSIHGTYLYAQESKSDAISIHWYDLGILQDWKSSYKTGDSLGKDHQQYRSQDTRNDTSDVSQFLFMMPTNDELDNLEETTMKAKIYYELKTAITKHLDSGKSKFEIHAVQNIGLPENRPGSLSTKKNLGNEINPFARGGYADAKQQARVEKFARYAGWAITEITQNIEKTRDRRVEHHLSGASNGGVFMTESIPEMKRINDNILSVDFDNSRASFRQHARAIESLGDQSKFTHATGQSDYPAPGPRHIAKGVFNILEPSLSNFETLKKIEREYPGTRNFHLRYPTLKEKFSHVASSTKPNITVNVSEIKYDRSRRMTPQVHVGNMTAEQYHSLVKGQEYRDAFGSRQFNQQQQQQHTKYSSASLHSTRNNPLILRDHVERYTSKVDLIKTGLEHINTIRKQNVFKYANTRTESLSLQLDKVKNFYDLTTAFETDIKSMSKNNLKLSNSHVVETLAKQTIIKKAGQKIAMQMAKAAGKTMTKETVTAAGLDDILHGGVRAIRDRKIDIKTWELLLDGAVGLTWWHVGNLVGGPATGKAYQEVAVKTGQVIRENSQGLFNNIYRAYTGDSHRKQILVQEQEMQVNRRRAFNNFSSQTASFNPQQKVLSVARIKENMDRNSNRTVIFGYGPAAKKKYDNAVRKVGRHNVKWVHSIPDNSQRRNIAKNFNADTVSTIRHQAYRETTRHGVTRRVPISHQQRNNEGGATTNKAYVTWDNNEWPFIPIFGLLYFAPVTSSEINGG